jgi:hypothetical protein
MIGFLMLWLCSTRATTAQEQVVKCWIIQSPVIGES